MVAVKPKDRKDDLQKLFSLTCATTSSLTHVPQLSECVTNREAHSLFKLILDLTITYQG